MWVPITIENVKTVLSDTEFGKITNAKLASGQTGEGVVAEAVGRVVRMVRSYAAKRNPLGPEGTIPDEVIDGALAIVRQRIFTRLPNIGLFDENRRAEVRDAMTMLKALSSGEILIEQPEDASPEQVASETIETVSSTTRLATREKLAGL